MAVLHSHLGTAQCAPPAGDQSNHTQLTLPRWPLFASATSKCLCSSICAHTAWASCHSGVPAAPGDVKSDSMCARGSERAASCHCGSTCAVAGSAYTGDSRTPTGRPAYCRRRRRARRGSDRARENDKQCSRREGHFSCSCSFPLSRTRPVAVAALCI